MIFTAKGILFMLSALLVSAVVVGLIRRRLLRESYAMLWLAFSAILLLFGVVPELLLWISEILGLYYLTTTIGIAFLFLTAIVMQYSIVLSRRSDENRMLAQRIALLQERLERLERREHPQPPLNHKAAIDAQKSPTR